MKAIIRHCQETYKNSKFQSQVAELCRSSIFADPQLLSQPRGGGSKFLELLLPALSRSFIYMSGHRAAW